MIGYNRAAIPQRSGTLHFLHISSRFFSVARPETHFPAIECDLKWHLRFGADLD
jgi:hypothetical protein